MTVSAALEVQLERIRTKGAPRIRRPAPGQALAELAIILPVLMILLLGILQIGFLIFTQVGLTNAVRETARNASTIPVARAADASTAAVEYYRRLTEPTTGFLKRNVGGYDANRLVVTGTPRTRVCYYSFTDASGAPAVMAQVEVDYSHFLFIPLIAPILDGTDGLQDGGLRLGATEAIRVGNGILTSTDIGDIGNPTCNP